MDDRGLLARHSPEYQAAPVSHPQFYERRGDDSVLSIELKKITLRKQSRNVCCPPRPNAKRRERNVRCWPLDPHWGPEERRQGPDARHSKINEQKDREQIGLSLVRFSWNSWKLSSIWNMHREGTGWSHPQRNVCRQSTQAIPFPPTSCAGRRHQSGDDDTIQPKRPTPLNQYKDLDFMDSKSPGDSRYLFKALEWIAGGCEFFTGEYIKSWNEFVSKMPGLWKRFLWAGYKTEDTSQQTRSRFFLFGDL